MPYPSKKSNDIARAASALRKALKTAAALLEDPDPSTRLKAVHGVSTAAGTLAKLAELSDIEQRLQILEQSLATKQPRMKKVIL